MTQIDISFLMGIVSVLAVLYAIWFHRTVGLIKNQVRENARGISASIENQKMLAEMMLRSAHEFKESTSYQVRVMDEFLETYFRTRDGGHHE